MRIEYVAHACLLLDVGGVRVATDPWWAGPCYANQWHVFPRPLNAERVDRAEAIVFSHGHADHLHEPTIRTLTPGKRAYYPFYWYGGTPDWLSHLGFGTVAEGRSGETLEVAPGVRLTYLVCGQDAIMVFEAGGRVLVNVNDALHATSPDTIALYCAKLRERWPHIDVVFCGFGGASYFPNVFDAPGRDRRALGALREELFADAFCRIVAALAPDVAVPFAADFVLLADRQRWINDVRFPREALPGYFDQHYRPPGCTTQVVAMYSGDVLDNGRLIPSSPYRAQLRGGSLDHLIDEQYPVEMSVFAADALADDAAVHSLALQLERHLPTQARYYSAADVDGLRFAVRLTDAPSPAWLEARLSGGVARVARVVRPSEDVAIRIETSTAALRNSIDEDWGGDDLIIGYGCEIEADSPAQLRQARVAAELMVRHPRPAEYARRHPLRTARYVAQTWFATRAKLRSKLGGRSNHSAVADSAWLVEPPERLRRRLGLPEPSQLPQTTAAAA